MADFGLSALASLGAGELLALGGTALDVIGGISQAVSGGRAAKDQAKAIGVETEMERRQQERRNRQILARNRVAAAGSVDPFSGSPLEVEMANAFEGGMNDAFIKYSGDSRAHQARVAANQAYGQIPGIIGGGLLQGGSIMGGWYKKSKGSGLGAPLRTPGFGGGVGSSAGGFGGGYIY